MPIAEWPAPSTATVFAGKAARGLAEDVRHSVGDLRGSLSPIARKPLAPAGLGENQVPDASMTASATSDFSGWPFW